MCCCSSSVYCTVQLWGRLQSRITVHGCMGDYIRINCLLVKVTAVKVSFVVDGYNSSFTYSAVNLEGYFSLYCLVRQLVNWL